MKYRVVNESPSAHCCFNSAVIFDDENGREETICETFEITDAEEICKALNEMEVKRNAEIQSNN